MIENVIDTGKRYLTNGYVHLVLLNHPKADKKGRYYEHRWVMEKHLGRFLERSEVVHHLDENRSNNGLDNLQLMLNSEHSSTHHSKRKPKKVIGVCKCCKRTIKLIANEYCFKCYFDIKRKARPFEKCSNCGNIRQLTSKKRMICESCAKGYNQQS